MKNLWSIALVLVVIAHFVLLFAVIFSLMVLPFKADWYIALPCMIYQVNLIFTNLPCSMTKLENLIRRKAGKQEIKHFIKYYMQARGQ